MNEVNHHQENEPRPAEEKGEVFDKKLFKEINDTMFDFITIRGLAKQEATEKLQFLKQNAHALRPMLGQLDWAHSVVNGLRMLAKYSEYDRPGANSDKEYDPYDNDVVKFALTMTCALQPDIEQARWVTKEETVWLYDELVEKGDDIEKSLGANFLSQHLADIKKGLLSDHQRLGVYLGCVNNILNFGTPDEQQRASEMVIEFADECKNDDQFLSIINLMTASSDIGLILKAEEMIDDELTAAGLSYQELLEDWERSEKSKEGIYAKWVNLKAIKEIERKKKGGCKFLHKEFGISDFGRYPPELLLKQIEEAESKKNPYGVIIFPRDDWNGAFYADADVFRKLYKQLDGEFSLRFFECESKTDIARALIKSNKHYNPSDGSGHKISLLVLGGHGSEKRINFGGDERPSERHYLTADDLMGGGVKRAGQFFEENPTIILSSCSTGAEGGIGQELSKRFGAKVIAPKEPTALTGIHANKNRGQDKFRFNATYSAKGSKNLFKSGSLAEK